MPVRPLKPCAWPGCATLVRGKGYCERHQPLADAKQHARRQQVHQAYNEQRDESDAFYKTERWKRLSIRFRKLHPLCCECEREGRVTPSKMVDHIQPRKAHPELSLEWSNLRALCWPCHNRIGQRVGLQWLQGRG